MFIQAGVTYSLVEEAWNLGKPYIVFADPTVQKQVAAMKSTNLTSVVSSMHKDTQQIECCRTSADCTMWMMLVQSHRLTGKIK